MLTGIITNYLTQHRRLVVPQLGTFVVKVPEGGVVFSELLKRDDGILRGLLVQQGGMNDLEAAGAIDRFVFEVRHALEHEGAYAIEGFGRLTLSPGGAIVFQAVLATPVAAAGNRLRRKEIKFPRPQLFIPLPSLRLRSPLHPVCDPVPKRRLLL